MMIAENETMKTSKEFAPSMGEAVQQIFTYLENEQKHRDSYAEKYRETLRLSDLKQPQHNQKGETVLPVVGDTSSGKSSVVNKLLRYPILPVAAESTSACPVEIRYAEAAQERLEVAPIDIKNVYKSQKACFTFGANSTIDKQTFQAIYTYAQDLARVPSEEHPTIVLQETLGYFEAPDPSLFNSKPREGEIPGTILTRENPRHVMFLLMLLLAIHAGQDKEAERLVDGQKQSLQERNRLMQTFGIPTDMPYLIRLYWHSPSIPKNTVIIDLPGLGADNRTTNATIADDKQVEAYLSASPSVMFLLGNEGTIRSEDVKTKINNFIEANSAKSSPARLSFVINKADLITRLCKKQQPLMDNAVNSIRQKYDDLDDRYKDFPMFAVSAFAGEKWYLESDIPPENLLKTRERYVDILERETWEERIKYLKNRLDDDFNAEYACRIDNDTIKSMNLETFFRQFFSEQVEKLHLLQALDTVEWHFKNVLQSWTEKIQTELDLLNTTKCFGSAASKEIYKVAEDALKTSFNTVSGIVDDAMLDMEAELVCADLRITGEMTAQNERSFRKMSEKQKKKVTKTREDIQGELPLVHVFKNCNDELNKLVMNHFAAAVQGMEKSTSWLNGRSFIPLDYHSTGKAFRNYEKLKEATGKLAQRKLDKFFTEGYKALRGEMHEEAEVYKELCDLVVNELEGLPNAMAQAMKKQFDAVFEKVQDTAAKQVDTETGNHQVKLTTLKDDFQKHYDSAINHLKDVVCSDVNEIVYRLREAPGADDEINKTVNLVRQALASILEPYTKPDHAKIIVDRITDIHYFVADKLDAAAFERFLKNDYINDFEEKLKKGIRDAFISDSNNEVYGHTERMQKAVEDVKNVYVSEEQLDVLKKFICDSNISVNAEKTLRDLPKRLQTAAKDLCTFVDEQSLYALLQEPWVERLDKLPWASKTIAGVSEKANCVKQMIDKTMEAIDKMILQDGSANGALAASS